MKRDIDKFHLMKVFHAVATQGSFTKGAQALGMTASSVSKAVQQLETVLKIKLLHRTTRTQSLTDNGRDYLVSAQRILDDLRELEDRLHQQGQAPSGLLRVTAPTSIGQFLIGPHIPSFLRRYPAIRVELVLEEKLKNITEEGFDVAIRSANAPQNSPLFSKKLGSHTRKLVASPAYLAHCNELVRPDQLNGLNLLTYTGMQAPAQWTFQKGGEKIKVEPEAVYSSNNYLALYQAALQGIGVANLYQYLVDDAIREGQLVHLLANWTQSDRDLYAVYQQNRQTSPKLDKFLEFLKELF